MPRLDFTHRHSYEWAKEGVQIPVVLRSSGETIDLLANVDTGASHCIFEREHGEMLNLNLEAGDPKTFYTATGRVDTFGHLVSLDTLDIRFEAVVYFFADSGINKNLLGRIGWLDRVRFGLVHYDHEMYVAAYDFDSQ